MVHFVKMISSIKNVIVEIVFYPSLCIFVLQFDQTIQHIRK